jgi:hypothetical protein
VVVGSDDIALDLATSGPHSSNPRRHFRSHGQARWAVLRCCGTGSHIAGTKLVDPETGEFSLSYRDQVLPGRDIAVVRLVVREQGLLVAPGNPLGVHAIADLAYGARYVDRRAGSVTRALFDRALRRRSHVDLRLRTAGTDAPGRRRLGCLGALRLRPRNPRCRSSVRARPRPVEERTVRSRAEHGLARGPVAGTIMGSAVLGPFPGFGARSRRPGHLRDGRADSLTDFRMSGPVLGHLAQAPHFPLECEAGTEGGET